MLQIRPNCECCDKDLAPDSTEAMICTYECTFCQQCVDEILENVCPNCGGGFMHRPIRPKTARRDNVCLEHQPPSSKRVHTPYSKDEIKTFAATTKRIAPANR
ncbi:DUF1272 domain-containing protein [Aestuariirhabdus sp. Z084]|uniref:DUF1272 domain-containing protein n=1 Tax=Aestuariirhabdus haliotis TaxID=2918751 RepID=UPI00201B392F|nr:DUF1272 domain-containing protein [Aestuariirhabdus haliotis]MCL6415275.1 DUF1272 domain-containing protein [Aestuariirhabdus haliotis]MCL6419535.1 DUF1272 domain-containing protein [Aestuariirhabdus haliotis]